MRALRDPRSGSGVGVILIAGFLAACVQAPWDEEEKDVAPEAAPAPAPSGPVGSPPIRAEDLPTSPPAPGNAKVRLVTGSGAPAVGIGVIWTDVDGALVDTIVTDAAGVVERKVDREGMMVTALLKRAHGYEDSLTWVGVKPGDSLFAQEDATSTSTNAEAKLALPPAPAGANSFDVSVLSRSAALESVDLDSDCYFGLQQVAVPAARLSPRCMRNGRVAVLATASIRSFNGSNPPVGYSVTRDAAIVDGTVSGFGQWHAPTSMTAIVTNIPPGAQRAEFTAHGLLGGIGSRFAGRTFLDNPGESATFTEENRPPPAIFDSVQQSARVAFATDTASVSLTLSKRGKVTSPAYAIDASAMLPQITSATFEAGGARPTVRWAAPATLDASDGLSVAFGDGQRRWRFIVPPGARSVRLPELPPLASDWAPLTLRSVRPTVTAYESDLLAGYDAFRNRQHFFVRFDPSRLNDIWGPWGLPADGTVRRSSFGPFS
jgi:hypothetical protein